MNIILRYEYIIRYYIKAFLSNYLKCSLYFEWLLFIILLLYLQLKNKLYLQFV